MTGATGDKPVERGGGDGGETNLGFTESEEPTRKVSISLNSEVNEDRLRKISSTSTQSRPKSILVNAENFTPPHCVPTCLEHGRKCSVYSNDYRRYSVYSHHDEPENSWWFTLCMKCRQKETGPGWEPSHWQSVCPYPFCPTYRHVARVFSLFLLGFMAWGIIYAIMGSTAAPGGQLFDIALLCIAANFGGWIFRMATMPPLVGMLVVGIIFQNLKLTNIHGEYLEVVAVSRKIALVVILIRAGLDLDAEAMKRLTYTVLRMGLIPWLVECLVVAIMSHYLLGLPFMWGILLGSVVAAVSPAVVVPCLIRLRSKGYGVAKGIPTLIIAVSGIDDATSVAAFGIISSIMFSNNSLVYQILLGPLSVIIGIGFGIVWGILAKYVPEKEDPFVVPLRILILLGGGLLAVLGSEVIGFEGAGPLGCVGAAFLSCSVWVKQGWEVEDNPVATAFEIFWMIFEPVLFALCGTQVKINEMDGPTVAIGLGILAVGLILRIIATVFVAVGSKLNTKEKIFCALSWMSKASVQAALGPVALTIVSESDGSETDYAKIVLMITLLSIIFTAPLSAIVITITGSKLLTKTAEPIVTDGWRRSARPSLRDITIFNDETGPERRQRPSVIVEAPVVGQP